MNDFSRLDFDRLWRGRSRVTDVENRIILSMIPTSSRRTAFELGAGNGRIARVLCGYFSDYYALDKVPNFLEGFAGQCPVKMKRIVGDILRIPACDNSVDVVLMIRVFNFLDNPQRVLSEIYRILRPGGLTIISYFHRWSVSDLIDRILSGTDGERHSAVEGFMAGKRRVLRSNFNEFFYSRSLFSSMAESAGFTVENICASGLEDYRPLSHLPVEFYVRLSRALAYVVLVPHSFVALRKPKEGDSEGPDTGTVLACPDCHKATDVGYASIHGYYLCVNCHHKISYKNGIFFS